MARLHTSGRKKKKGWSAHFDEKALFLFHVKQSKSRAKKFHVKQRTKQRGKGTVFHVKHPKLAVLSEKLCQHRQNQALLESSSEKIKLAEAVASRGSRM